MIWCRNTHLVHKYRFWSAKVLLPLLYDHLVASVMKLAISVVESAFRLHSDSAILSAVSVMIFVNFGSTNNLFPITTEDLGILVDRSRTFPCSSCHNSGKDVLHARHDMTHLSESGWGHSTSTLQSIGRSILEHGNCVCGVVYCGDQDNVERVQRRATEMVVSIRHLPYQEILERQTTEQAVQKTLGNTLKVRQILTGRICINPAKLFQLVPPEKTAIRGHGNKLLKLSANWAWQHTNSHQVTDNWNRKK